MKILYLIYQQKWSYKLSIRSYSYNLNVLNLITKTGTKDITSVISLLELTNNIFQPFTSCHTRIKDTGRLEELGGFCGEEILKLNLEIDGYTIKKEFEILSINNIDPVDSGLMGGKWQTIDIYWLEKGWKNYFFKKFSRYFDNKKIHEIVEYSITKFSGLKNLKTKTQTKEAIEFPSPYYSTNQLINFLIPYSFSNEDPKDSGFLLFSNNEGRHFRSISSLLKEPEVFTLKHENDINRNSNSYALTSHGLIRNLQTTQFFDIFQMGTTGTFGSEIMGYDTTTGNSEILNIKLKDYLNQTETLGNFGLFSKNLSDTNEYEKYFTEFNTIPFENRDFMAYKLFHRMRLMLLTQNKKSIITGFNPVLDAGKIVKLEIKSSVDLTSPNELLNGKYFIISCNHKINIDNSNDKIDALTNISISKDAWKKTEHGDYQSISTNKNA